MPDTNTDPPVKTLEETQGPTYADYDIPLPAPTYADYDIPLPAADSAGSPAYADYDIPVSSTSVQTAPGVGANDDNTPPNPITTQANVDTAQTSFNKIEPRPNILDNYASYTWSASIYIMSLDQYEKFLKSSNRSIPNYRLLMQSGGAPPNKTGFVGAPQPGATYFEGDGAGSTSATTEPADAGRNPAFPLDFYIDNIRIKSVCLGKGSGSAHNVSELEFQVTEPNGLTLLDRLYQAAQDAAPKNASGAVDYMQACYMLVLRWYGYDINGNIMPPATKGMNFSDSRAISEKYIPFYIKDVAFQVTNKLVTYDFKCNPVGQLVAGTSRRGTVNNDVELTGKTVFDVLVGTATNASNTPADPGASSVAGDPNQSDAETQRLLAQNASTPSAPKADAAPTVGQNIAVSLTQAMNNLQKELVKKGTFEYADTYEIVFAPGAEDIKNAKITLDNPTSNNQNTPMAQPDPSNALPEKGSVAFTNRNITIPAGMSMLYAIEQIIRNSSYIRDQANVSTSEADEPDKPKTQPSAKTMKWFNITMEAVPDGGKNDTKRNAPVYKIRYVISSYVLQNFVSNAFPVPRFLGVHKTYPYWFTGQNTAVLDYSANFSGMYQLIVSGNKPGANQQATLMKKQSASMRDQIKWYFAPRSSESSAGADLKGNEIPAEAAEYLNNPGSLGSVKLKIIGDPGWIQQGSIVRSDDFMQSGPQPFLPDGTINFDVTQPMFEIAWQKPEDYNVNTGLADPYSKPINSDRQPKQSYIYNGVNVVSEFRGGKFEQTIEGSLYPFPNPEGTNTVNKANPANKTGETAERTGVDLSASAGQAARSAFAAVDPRRLDKPAAGSDTGTTPAPPAPDGTSTSQPSSAQYADYDMPVDTIQSQNPPAPADSDGEQVGWYDYEPPPKMGELNNSATTTQTQNMVVET